MNGLEITSAPPMRAIYGVLGEPSRVHVPVPAAPPGHRNNQIHVYDALGVRVNEHHFTFLAQELGLTFDCDDPAFAFTPKEPFRGELVIDNRSMPLGGPEADFVRACPLPLEHTMAGVWRWEAGGFFVGLDARGDRLSTGRRSRNRRVIGLSISWPHDPWDRSARPGSAGTSS
ncbi:Hypothetical protein A7982_06135 [Minicystis rosea]|nr:Hypothetical protein A7982_06135 [Minicystis rosea]